MLLVTPNGVGGITGSTIAKASGYTITVGKYIRRSLQIQMDTNGTDWFHFSADIKRNKCCKRRRRFSSLSWTGNLRSIMAGYHLLNISNRYKNYTEVDANVFTATI